MWPRRPTPVTGPVADQPARGVDPEDQAVLSALPSAARPVVPPVSPIVAPPPLSARRGRVGVLAIGVSTGGPQVLGALIPRLPKTLPVGVLVVQHMPPMFTRMLAEQLQSDSAVEVREAEEGMDILPGRVIIAKGDHHMRAVRRGIAFVVALDQAPPENCVARPWTFYSVPWPVSMVRPRSPSC